MKNSIKIIAFTLIIFNFEAISAQVNSYGNTSANSTNQSSFIEASGFEGYASNKGKGINFPRTNLTTFTFITDLLDSGDILNSFDGFVVYNTATGNTATNVGGNNGVVTAVIPGFYYFSNPNGAVNENITAGVWTPLGSGSGTATPVKAYSSTESTAGVSVNGKEVFALTGTFTTLGVNALITIAKPLGMTGYYKMTTYIGGKTFRNEISSFNIDPLVLTDNVVTGNGLFSEVYPAGTYTYTLEYFKS